MSERDDAWTPTHDFDIAEADKLIRELKQELEQMNDDLVAAMRLAEGFREMAAELREPKLTAKDHGFLASCRIRWDK